MLRGCRGTVSIHLLQDQARRAQAWRIRGPQRIVKRSHGGLSGAAGFVLWTDPPGEERGERERRWLLEISW